jgi:signal transduction histidine kinase
MMDLERSAPTDDEGVVEVARDARWVAVASVAWAIVVAASIAMILARLPGEDRIGDLGFTLLTATFGVAGVAILRRQPQNRVGWILLSIGAAWAAGNAFENYGSLALSRRLPGAAASLSISAGWWVPPIMLMGTVLLLRFPDGRLTGERWRLVERIAVVSATAMYLLILIAPGTLADSGYPNIVNPFGIRPLAWFTENATAIVVILPLVIVASAVNLVQRFRRSSGIERLQLKWLVAAGAVVASIYLVAMVVSTPYPWLGTDTPGWVYAIQLAALCSFGLIPLALGVAVLRYRLYEIDVVINKALVYGSLAAFITVAYVGIVVGIGHVLGRTRDVALSVVATAVVAVAFAPVKERMQRLANRLVYGRRAAPYDVLAHLSSRITGAFETDDVLPRLARLLVDGTGAAHVEIWLRVGDRIRRTSDWPHGDGGVRELALVRGELPEIAGASYVAAVRDEGELFGAIAVRKTPGDPVTPPEQALTEDVARQAALLLRNVRLIEELRASRERIVAAQDDERRRLERDIHDGAQQQLVTLSLATRLAQSELGPDAPTALSDLLERAIDESKQALAELRELARGIHPRILTERGLPAAIRSLAERSPVPVTVDTETEDRLPEAVEATAYFAVSEALQNVAKYANASAVVVTAERQNGSLVVRVSDDGVGGADPSKGSGLRGLLDRIDAVGGRLEVDSPPGEGTCLTVALPAG